MQMHPPVSGQNETISRPANSRSGQNAQPRAARHTLSASSKDTGLTKSLDGGSIQTLLMISTGFLIFFVLLASSILLGQRNDHNLSQTSAAYQDAGNMASTAAARLDAQLAWIDQALASRGSAQQIIGLVARGKDVQGALVVSANNTVLAATENAKSAGPAIPVKDFPQAGIKIMSLISDSGAVSPVIIRRAGKAYLAVILTPGSLINYTTQTNALVLNGGGIVDAPAEMGRIGGLAYLGLGVDRLSALKNKHPLSHRLNGEKVWLTARTIPNSTSISVVSATPKTTPKNWLWNILAFLLMLVGTIVLVWMLLRNVLTQLKRVEDSIHDNEISEQRYRAALEGNRGGIFEIDLTANTAYISRSLAELLGLAAKEQDITLPQFLGLFHEGDREKLYSVTRRAHVGEEFVIDMNVAHLPLTLAARGRQSVRGSDMEKVVIGVAMDVTEQRGAALRLQAAEARLADALGSMNDSFVLWDPRDRLVLWNRQFELFFGFQPGNLGAGMDRGTIE